MTHDVISCPGYKSEKKIDLEMKDPDNPDKRYKPQQPHRTAPHRSHDLRNRVHVLEETAGVCV